MSNWIIPFKSFSGTSYRVLVGGNPASSDVTLTGADAPFTIQEDTAKDIFTPVRKQTGYLKFIDPDGLAADIMPTTATSRPVTLEKKAGNLWVTAWRGYVKAADYGLTPFDKYNERSVPVVDIFSILNGMDMPVVNYEPVISFAELIYIATAAKFTKYSFQHADAYSDSDDAVLKKMVSYSSFISIDKNGNVKSQCSRLECLQRICTFFGWTARVEGTEIFFMKPYSNETNIDSIWFDPDGYVDEYSSAVLPSPTALTRTMFATDRNQVTVMQGYNEVKAACGLSTVSKVITLDPGNNVVNHLRDSVTSVYIGQDRDKKLYTLYNGYEDFESDDFFFDFSEYAYYLYQDLSEVLGKYSYDWTFHFHVAQETLDWQSTIFSIRSKKSYAFNGGVIAIDFNYQYYVLRSIAGHDSYEEEEMNGPMQMYCRLRVGNKWYGVPNPQSEVGEYDWRDYETFFKLPDGLLISELNKVRNTRVLDSAEGYYSGYGIRVDNGLAGDVQFDIVYLYNYSDDPQEQDPYVGLPMRIEGLSVAFVPDLADTSEDEVSSIEAIATNQSYFTQKKNVSLKFSNALKGKWAQEFVINPDGSPCYQFTEQTTPYKQEQALANDISAFYSVPRQIADFELKTEAIALTPLSRVSWNNGTYYPQAIEHDWRDDVSKVKLIKI